MEREIPCKYQSKESWISCIHIKVDFKAETITRLKER